jgi:hypothetical protein
VTDAREELAELLRESPELAEVIAQELTDLGYTVTPPLPPSVAIGAGERAPWANLPLHCPTCGTGPLPLQEFGSSPGITLRYISHCDGTWLRGEADL